MSPPLAGAIDAEENKSVPQADKPPQQPQPQPQQQPQQQEQQQQNQARPQQQNQQQQPPAKPAQPQKPENPAPTTPQPKPATPNKPAAQEKAVVTEMVDLDAPTKPADQNQPRQQEEQMIANKLRKLVGPMTRLPPLDKTEIKFNGRTRLYIENLTGDVTEEEVMSLFSPYGEASKLFLNKETSSGFINMDYRVNAEKAKHELDGKNLNGRTLRVKFAPHNSAVLVQNLSPFVSNELLYRAFEIFGKIERAYVKVDERGKSVGEGVVEYANEPSASAAIRKCTQKSFFLTSSLQPVIVESFKEPAEFDGYPEKNLPTEHPEFLQARYDGPRFSKSAFEHECGTLWKKFWAKKRLFKEIHQKLLAVEEAKFTKKIKKAIQNDDDFYNPYSASSSRLGLLMRDSDIVPSVHTPVQMDESESSVSDVSVSEHENEGENENNYDGEHDDEADNDYEGERDGEADNDNFI